MHPPVVLPDTQLVLRPGCIDFGWGHPDSALLPVEDLRRAASHALRGGDGALALAYGAAQGPGRLIDLLRVRLGRLEGVPPAPQQMLITGGVSQALDLLCTLLTRPGDSVLVESPAYHLALRIFRDHGLRLWPVAADDDGLRLDALERTLTDVQREGKRARLLYTVPTFTNPTGRSLSAERRAALVQLAARHDLLILEDDAYRELWYDTPPPPPLTSYGAPTHVARMGSFAKILAPGLRLGWLQADAPVVQRCVDSGLLDSGGGVNHFTAHVVAEYLRRGLLDAHVERLRATYRARRDHLMAALQQLPAGCRVLPPGGGYFVWLRVPDGLDTTALLARAEEAGVSYVPGAPFQSDGDGQHHLRLAFSRLSPVEMDEGARRLAHVLRNAGANEAHTRQ